MKLIGKIFFSFLINGLAIFLAANFIKGFILEGDILSLAKITLLFTLINVFLYPILKFIFSPLIILTFGLFVIILNAALLWLLDIFSPNIIIEGIYPLILATLFIGLVNFIFTLTAKLAYGKR